MMILLAAPATLVLGAATDTSILDQAFGNTVVETYPDGRTAELWLQRDGAYAAMGRSGDRSSGRWSLKGDKVCLKQQHPWSPFSYCTPIPPSTAWIAKAVTGEPVRVRLVQGVSTPPGPG
jgi:hypothetical protein